MSRFEPLRVALATDSLSPSGVGQHMLDLGLELARSHQVTLLFPVSPAGKSFLSRGARLGLGIKELDADEAATTLWLQRMDVDLLHVHAGIGWEGHGLAASGHAAGIPVIRTEHLPYVLTDPAQRAEHRRGLELVSRVIAVSDAAMDSFGEADVDEQKLVAIRNGIARPEPTSRRADVRAELGFTDDDLLIVTVARFTRQKGHRTLIAAMSQVASALGSARLVLVGDGDERRRMEKLARRLGIADRVLFVGERLDVADILLAAELFVLPSLFEGLPLALLEAMALGIPVVATRIGGTLEALGEDHPWYAPPGDRGALAATIVTALAEHDRRALVGAIGRQRFEADYQSSRMGQQTAAVYADVTQSASAEFRKSKLMQKTRLGFIGAGGIAQRHLGVLEQFEDVSISAFADTDFGRAEASALRYGARAFGNHADMLEAMELDALYICVPPFAHGPAERKALSRSLPFFVEKPLSLDLGLAESIAREVQQTGLITAVGYHWRYLDTVDEARRLLAENPAHLMSGYWLDQTPPPQWWWRNDRSGGQMVEQATHIVDLARYLAGDIVDVFGMASRRDRAEFDGLDVATASTASLRFESGAVANIGATCLLRWGHRIGLHVFADGLALELSDRELMVDVGAGRPVRHAEGDPVWREDRDFIDAVRGGENRIRCPYAEALVTHRVTLAISKSARTGMPIALRPSLVEAANG